ncbi:MAG: DUF4157 domain-containing protein [Bacteroidota bacterium]
MHKHLERAASNELDVHQVNNIQHLPILDNRKEAIAQRQQLSSIHASTAVQQLKAQQDFIQRNSTKQSPIQQKPNNTGLPNQLKAGVETLSGISMDDVKVHYNSSQPAQLNAHAYAQGNQIHLGPGQEQHLPHEAWHVVQQKQGRVQPTKQLKGKVAINDDEGLEAEADWMGAKAMQMKEWKASERTNVLAPQQITQRTVIQLEGDAKVLSEEERKIKEEDLINFVLMTTPTHLATQGLLLWNKLGSIGDYIKALLAKINTGNYQEALKAAKNMRDCKEDDDWSDDSPNCKLLNAVVNQLYEVKGKKLALKAGATKKIGANNPGEGKGDKFEEHDCVWAAIDYIEKKKEGKTSTLETEKEVADAYDHAHGEVSDAVLHRVMEELGYKFIMVTKDIAGEEGRGTSVGKGKAMPAGFFFGEKGKAPPGTYIVSENRNASGSSGHVFVVEVTKEKVKSVDAMRRKVSIYDRQAEERDKKPRTTFGEFGIYVWKAS